MLKSLVKKLVICLTGWLWPGPLELGAAPRHAELGAELRGGGAQHAAGGAEVGVGQPQGRCCYQGPSKPCSYQFLMVCGGFWQG